MSISGRKWGAVNGADVVSVPESLSAAFVRLAWVFGIPHAFWGRRPSFDWPKISSLRRNSVAQIPRPYRSGVTGPADQLPSVTRSSRLNTKCVAQVANQALGGCGAQPVPSGPQRSSILDNAACAVPLAPALAKSVAQPHREIGW